jgi:hypothetical protein
MHTEGHDMGKPEDVQAHPAPQIDDEHPGYEIEDVNAAGIAYFLGGLLVSVVVFFVLCFYLGKVINGQFVKDDGAPDKWHQYGNTQTVDRQNLTPNPVLVQKDLDAITKTFPSPRLDVDDGNQSTANLHAHEDLLLDNYSSDNGTTRIPIDRAMQLIAQRGLGAAPAPSAPKTLMAGDSIPVVQAPLTTGFARTGYELDTIEKRDQQNSYKQATEAKKE